MLNRMAVRWCLMGALVGLGAGLWPGADGVYAAEPRLPFLLDLQGGLSTVRYTHGSLDRSAHLQRRLDLLAGDVVPRLGLRAGLECLVLSREEWQAMGWSRAYGLPLALGPSRLAVPAWGDPGALELWERALGRSLPPAPGMPMRGTPEEATAIAASDLLTQIEAARALVEGSGLQVSEPSVAQAIAQLAAVDGFMRYESRRLVEIDGLFAALERPPGSPAAATEDRAWLAEQARGYRTAREALAASGIRPLKKLLKRARKGRTSIAAADLAAAYGSVFDPLRQRN